MPLISIDSFDKLVVKANSSGTSFADSSTANPKTITANGNATQLPTAFTDTPLILSSGNIKNNLTAGFFNGTSDYVVVPDHSDFDFGTGNYDIEFKVNFAVIQAAYFFDMDAQNLAVSFSPNTINVAQAGSSRINTAWSPVKNTWYHIRVQRVSGTTTLYIDSVSTGTPYVGSDTCNCGAAGIRLGLGHGTAVYFSGWLKELRVSSVARTVATPTTQYTSDANTKLLLHFNNPANSPIAPAIAFDGTGDYLSLADSADWDLAAAADPMTIEFSFMMTTVQSVHFISRNGSTDWAVGYAAGTFSFFLGGAAIATFTLTPVANRWYHVAAVKESNAASKVHLFVQGVIGTSGTHNAAIDTANVINIGRSTAGTALLIGSMRELRISNVARYTAAFTPSQIGFTVDANTKLYIKGNENNGVTTFIDSETTPKTVTTVGDTKINYTEDYRSCIFKDDGNTGHKPYPVSTCKVDFFSAFGSGVAYFDGTGDYLSVPDSVDWDLLSTDPLTLETFFRMGTVQTTTFISRSSNADWSLAYAAGTFTLYLSNAAVATFAFTPIVNTWYHLAGAKESNASSMTRLFLNGTKGTDGTHNTAVATANAINIGRDTAGTNLLIGLLDNVRIAVGVARYTATFNPPIDVLSNGGNKMMWIL